MRTFNFFVASSMVAMCLAGPNPNPKCTNVKIDGIDWYTSYGKEYGCSIFESNPELYCGKVGDLYRNFGLVANEACCVCGGGEVIPETQPPAPCEDITVDGEEWFDKSGPKYTCKLHYNRAPGKCLTEGFDYENKGHTAQSACCVCGGGSTGSNPSPTPPACEDLTIDGKAWFDKSGPKYSCAAHYNRYPAKCETDGFKYENFGHTAHTACCVCGGGSTGTNTQPPATPKPTTPKPTSCHDVLIEGKAWFDAGGPKYTCAAHYNRFPAKCSTDGTKYEREGHTAQSACCVCGGGVWA